MSRWVGIGFVIGFVVVMLGCSWPEPPVDPDRPICIVFEDGRRSEVNCDSN